MALSHGMMDDGCHAIVMGTQTPLPSCKLRTQEETRCLNTVMGIKTQLNPIKLFFNYTKILLSVADTGKKKLLLLNFSLLN